MSGFGKSKFGSNSTYYKNFKIVTDQAGGLSENKFRLLAAMKSQAETGVWAKYYGIHFGHKGRDQKDQTKLKMRTFKCVEDKDFRTKMVRVSCPECDLIEERQKQFDTRKAQLLASGKTEDDVKTLLAPLIGWLKDHNVDRKWYINAMNEAGEFGVLTISHKVKKQLETLIEELVKKDIDPLDVDQGVFFNFKRVGKKIGEMQDTVEILKGTKIIESDGEKLEVQYIKQAPLTAEQQAKALEICPDLNNVVTVVTREQVALLVSCGGDPDEVDSIFNMSAKRESSASTAGAAATTTATVVRATKPETPPDVSDFVATVEAAVSKVEAVAPATAVDEDDDAAAMAALQAKIAAKKAAKAEAAKLATEIVAIVKPATPTLPAGANPADMSDDDFMKVFGG